MGRLLCIAGAITRVAAYGAVRRARNLATLLLLTGFAAQAEEVTVAALGDSLTQGYGLPEADGFVPQLEAWLTDAGGAPVTVINAGVSGDTTAGGLARIDWTLTDDVDAVIVALGANDLLRGIEPAVSRENLEGILQAIQARDLPVLLAGMPAPGNYGPEYAEAFEAMYVELSTAYETGFFPNFLAGLGSPEQAAEMTALVQDDGLHPNAAGVERIVDAIGPAVLALVEEARTAD